ncbi:MAG: hypothetical protein KUG59_05475, partial [Parvibaculaceae bacterium]|nr:hypothetical protein [Parvibaculaceae bacterium]
CARHAPPPFTVAFWSPPSEGSLLCGIRTETGRSMFRDTSDTKASLPFNDISILPPKKPFLWRHSLKLKL